MKMKYKKVLAGVAAVAVLGAFSIGLTGCNQSSAADGLTAVDTSKTMEISALTQNELAGLCDYLEGNGCIAKYSNTSGELGYFEMMAELIGAEEGRKYTFKVGETQTNVEVYRYDTDNLNTVAQEVIQSVKERGVMQVKGTRSDGTELKIGGEVSAYLSDGGKYLVLNSLQNTAEEYAMNFSTKLKEKVNEYEKNESSIKVKKSSSKTSSSEASSSEASSSEVSSSEASSSEASSEAGSES